jgi:hypothetical protein
MKLKGATTRLLPAKNIPFKPRLTFDHPINPSSSSYEEEQEHQNSLLISQSDGFRCQMK